MHERKLHMQAIYRNEFLVGRGYGNYLGLGELQAYIAAQAGLQVGELLMTLGHVELDSTKGPIRAMLKLLDA
jgi:thymidylate synthase